MSVRRATLPVQHRERDVQVLRPQGFFAMAYGVWGEEGADLVPAVCVHGLTRNGRDFDPLARTLASAGRTVVCPDVLGRGRSAWLPVAAGYSLPLYVSDLAALLARLDVRSVDWIGTSMGGLIGTILAGMPQTPLRSLVLNDVGPVVARPAIERIGSYVGEDRVFADLAAVEAHLRHVHAPFGALPDAEWRTMALHSSRTAQGGGFRLHYDPRIGEALRAMPPDDVTLWPLWDAIKCPVLLIRGESSDLLTRETVAEMARRGPGAAGQLTVVEIPGCGHAPTLSSEAQIRIVTDWLQKLRG